MYVGMFFQPPCPVQYISVSFYTKSRTGAPAEVSYFVKLFTPGLSFSVHYLSLLFRCSQRRWWPSSGWSSKIHLHIYINQLTNAHNGCEWGSRGISVPLKGREGRKERRNSERQLIIAYFFSYWKIPLGKISESMTPMKE